MERTLKELYLVIGIAFASIIQFLLLIGAESHNELGPDIGSLTLMLSAICAFLLLAAVWRNSKPGRLWHLLLIIPATIGLAAVVPIRGALALWQLPIAGALFALMIAYPDHNGRGKEWLPWSFSFKQWALTALFTAIIFGIGIIAWFSRDSEAHLLARSIASALTVMAFWTTAITLAQKQWRIKDIRVALLRLYAVGLMLLAFLLLAYQHQLSQNSSTERDAYLSFLPGATALGLFFLALAFPRKLLGQAAIIVVAFIWVIVVSANHGLAYLPTLPVVGLLPLVVRFQSMALAFAFWCLIATILIAGFGAYEPILIAYGLSATLIFASTNWLVGRLEIFSDSPNLKVQQETQRLFSTIKLDQRSVIVGILAGAVVLIVGGILLAADFSRETTKTQTNSQIVAQRLADAVQQTLREHELLAVSLSQLRLERVTSQAEFEQATKFLSPRYPNTLLQWTPRGMKVLSTTSNNNYFTDLRPTNLNKRNEDLNHIIATGEQHWIVNLDDATKKYTLHNVVPIYSSDTAFSSDTLIGLAAISLRFDALIEEQTTFDAATYGLRISIDNPSTTDGKSKPKLTFNSNYDAGDYKNYGAIASARGSSDNDNEFITVNVALAPRQLDALSTLQARLQGMLILSILIGTITASNASRQNKVEAESKRTNARYRSIAAHSNEAIIICNDQGHIIDWNHAAEEIFGYTTEEAIGQKIEMIVPNGYLARHRTAFERASISFHEKKSRSYGVELEGLHKNGMVFPVQISVSGWEEDKLKFFFAIIRDISDRKKVEAALVAREQQFRSLLMGTTASLLLIDKAGYIRMVNNEACNLFGYSADEMIGMHSQLLLPETSLKKLTAFEAEYFNPGRTIRLGLNDDLQAVTKHGTIFDFELGVSSIVIDNQNHLIASVIDISDRKRAQMARSQFIANISHDLRTPLNAVLGYISMLQSAPLKGAYREQLKRLDHASNMLFSLVNDVLDWSKIEAGEIDLADEPFNLAHSFDALFSVMEGPAREKGLSLSFKNLSSLPNYVSGDATRFNQIIYNLVGNAIKFTENGKVVLEASGLPSKSPDKVRLLIEVSDTGIGITEENQKLLFDRFKQVDQGNTRRFQGSGLGLAIVKELALLMGGSVKVSSELNVGSKFSVELEFGYCNELVLSEDRAIRRDAGQAHERLLGKHVLLVDDSDLLIELITAMLEAVGAEVSTCTNGQEAIDWLTKSSVKVDMVLMDVHMPVMDGNTAVAIIRRNPSLKKLPVIAMTAGATKTNIEEALQAGMTDCITKPFTEELLITTLLKNARA